MARIFPVVSSVPRLAGTPLYDPADDPVARYMLDGNGNNAADGPGSPGSDIDLNNVGAAATYVPFGGPIAPPPLGNIVSRLGYAGASAPGNGWEGAKTPSGDAADWNPLRITGPMTAQVWFRPFNNASNPFLFAQGQAVTAELYYYCQLGVGNKITVGHFDGTSWKAQVCDRVLELNGPTYHVAFTRDAGGLYQIYIDGQSETFTGVTPLGPPPGPGTPEDSLFSVGEYGGAFAFIGMMAGVQIENVERTPAEIYKSYSYGAHGL